MWIKNLRPTSILEKSKAKLVELNRIYMMKKDWWSDEVHSLTPLWQGKGARNSQRKLAWPVQSWRDLAKKVVCCGKRITAIKVYEWAIKEVRRDSHSKALTRESTNQGRKLEIHMLPMKKPVFEVRHDNR